jgi:hypothetical protein
MPLARDTVLIPTIPVDPTTGNLAANYGNNFDVGGHGFFAVVLRIHWAETENPKDESKITDLLSGLLPYVMFNIFDTLQSDGKVMSAADGAGKTRPAILPPEWVPYPNEDLRRAIHSNNFFQDRPG